MAKDPDASLVALFKTYARKNEAKTVEAGRLICDDMEVCEIRAAGSRNFSVHPATALSHWENNPETGEQTPVTYAERFARQYQQFKARAAQTKSGTPLTEAAFLTESRRAELRAQNIYIVEQLAAIDGQELKNLGPGGRDLKNRAIEFIEASDGNAVNTKLAAELEAMRARNAVLEEDVQRLKEKSDGEFDDMTDEQLRDYITTNTGHAPHGSVSRKTLLRMAASSRPEKVA
jgi:hypothetical protein